VFSKLALAKFYQNFAGGLTAGALLWEAVSQKGGYGFRLFAKEKATP